MGILCCKENEDYIDTHTKKIFAAFENNSKIHIKIYDIENGYEKEVELRFSMIKTLEGFSQLTYNNSLYLLGSNSQKDFDGSFFLLFNLEDEEKFRFLITSISNHYKPTLCSYRTEIIIAIGGLGSKSCEMYNICSKKWKSLPELPEERFGCSAVSYEPNNYIYIFGGTDSTIGEYYSSVLRLSMKHRLSWETLTIFCNISMLARIHSAIAVCEENIIIFGGKTKDETCTKYIVEFNIQKKESFKSLKTLEKPAIFPNTNTGSFASKQYYFLDSEYTIHKFNKFEFSVAFFLDFYDIREE